MIHAHDTPPRVQHFSAFHFSQRFHGAKMADLEKKGLCEGREFSNSV